jgi:5-methylcytosine-specific restriction endonuclease McrA
MTSSNPPSTQRGPARTWFERGCEAFKLASPEVARQIPYDPFYVCPLCLHAFAEPALAQKQLTREHVPPRSLGGHRLVLTCAPCNKRGGHRLDCHARREADIYDFHEGELNGTQAVLKTASGRVPISLSASDGAIRAFCVPKAASPTVHAAMMDEFGRAATDNSWEGFSLNIEFAPFSHPRAATSWLRAAYLAFFASLGYRFTLRGELNVVRSRIAGQQSDEPRIFRIIRRERSQPRLVRIDQPAVFRSYAMFYGRNVVLLPASGDYELYDRLAEKPDNTAPMSGIEFPWPPGPMFQLDRVSP